MMVLFFSVFACSFGSTPSTQPTVAPTTPPGAVEPPLERSRPVERDLMDARGVHGADPDGHPVCGDMRVIFPFWPGEYPSPILQVNRSFTAKVYDSACGGGSPRDCTVPAALYHPWSKEVPEGTAFASRTGAKVYAATADFQWEERSIKAGTRLTVRSYLSEGFCAMHIDNEPFEGSCPGVSPDGRWEPVERDAPADDQVLRVPCDGGAPGWLRVDEALQKRPEIGGGTIESYGEVKRTAG